MKVVNRIRFQEETPLVLYQESCGEETQSMNQKVGLQQTKLSWYLYLELPSL